jgi:hypothetical protein
MSILKIFEETLDFFFQKKSAKCSSKGTQTFTGNEVNVTEVDYVGSRNCRSAGEMNT